MITVDEGDHFAGGVGTPQPGGNWLIYNHTTCTTPTPELPGEPGRRGRREHQGAPAFRRADLRHPLRRRADLLRQRPAARTDTTVRKLERDVGGLSRSTRTSATSNVPQTVPLTDSLADPVEENALHMVNTDPNRTPTFTSSATRTSSSRRRTPARTSSVRDPGFAWNHGDIQHEIGNTWVGMVGPGVVKDGDRLDHVDRPHEPPADDPSLAGLHDDYTDDGHVLVQALDRA